jgi:hypothetical protein
MFGKIEYKIEGKKEEKKKEQYELRSRKIRMNDSKPYIKKETFNFYALPVIK